MFTSPRSRQFVRPLYNKQLSVQPSSQVCLASRYRQQFLLNCKTVVSQTGSLYLRLAL